ncbi:type VI secretion system lipoprotein TssJ [Psychrobacter sp. KFRI-CH2-11]|uniref:type VI secretion system lipoprotein TssJ n=1 Tax=Psychrobacter sp. KFRI-CH2-11 TaxID=3156079 RepID=UPI0032558375
MLQNLKYTIVLSSLVTSSCTVFSNAKEKDYNQQVDFLVLTAPSVNLDVMDRAAPARLDIFQLTKKPTFIYEEYLDLIDEDNDLKGDLLVKDQHMIIPDTIKSIPLSLEKDTNYLGITTGFRDIENTSWKIVLQKQPPQWWSQNSYLYLKVDSSGIFQISKRQMKEELKKYAKRHPNDKSVTKSGVFKKPKYDYSKGIFTNKL